MNMKGNGGSEMNEQPRNARQLQGDAMRAGFDAWAGALFCPLDLEYSEPGETYCDPRTRTAWLSWQAARQPVSDSEWIKHPQTIEAKRQWDEVAAALGVSGDCPDAVLAAARSARQLAGVKPVGWLHTYKKTGESSLATYPIDMNIAFNRERWECIALYTAPASVPLEFDRTRDTPRRQTAVELLLSMGYVWATDHWEARKQPDAVCGGDVLPALPPVNRELGPMGDRPTGYNAEQMQDYARAALSARQPAAADRGDA